MVKRSGGSAINSDIARLKGARLVTCSEPNEGARLNEGLIKQLTGGDPVTARKLYGEEFEFQPEFKLWVSTNHKPIIRGTDIGVWRRIHLIPFNVQIPESKVDRQLKYKLEGELTGIFRWAVDGCLLYRKEGLRMPKVMQDSVKEYHREMDVLSAFIEDCCTEGKGLSVQSSQLYAAYLKWAEQGNEYTMSATKFSVEIAKRYEKVHTRGGKYFNGLTLLQR
jgi:putative DNA primase/helicase